jgi:hypothetical protein
MGIVDSAALGIGYCCIQGRGCADQERHCTRRHINGEWWRCAEARRLVRAGEAYEAEEECPGSPNGEARQEQRTRPYTTVGIFRRQCKQVIGS